MFAAAILGPGIIAAHQIFIGPILFTFLFGFPLLGNTPPFQDIFKAQ